jgi:hypothetical protein
MKEALNVLAAIDADAARLDELEAAYGTAHALLDQAEEAWLDVKDTIAESLKDEMTEAGRKGDPAEHWIETQARKHNRVAYTNYRRAKRAVDRISEQAHMKRSAMSGRQSELAALRDEVRSQPYQPQRHMGDAIGARRAA